MRSMQKLHPLTRRLIWVAPNGCWEWTGKRDRDGYVKLNRGLGHRVVYQDLVGPIPPGLTLDHLCRVRHCVNPDHMEPVTIKVNTLRGRTIQAANAQRTHCNHGHPFDAANTGRTRQGWRICRACNRERQRRTYRRLIAERETRADG